MSFLVNFLLGLGNPRHIATKSQHLWAVPRQIKFWSILKKSRPNSQLLPKICFESFPINVMLGFGRGGTSTITWGLEDLEASGAAGLEASVLTAAVLIQTETPF